MIMPVEIDTVSVAAGKRESVCVREREMYV